MKRLLPLALLLASASPAAGQVADQLKQAMDAYEKSNVELAKNLFATIIASRQQVTPEQRVTAFKYLGAYWALQSTPGARDSANNFFVAAIDYDPFTDLDRRIFAADEQNAFARARLALFKIGIAPVEPKALDPTSTNADSSRYQFHIVSTHNARMTASIVRLSDPGSGAEEVLATIGNGEGVRDIAWTGLVNNARADTGLYEFRVVAYDNIRNSQTAVTERQRFRIEHVHAKLEEELPAFRDVNLGGTDTLRSRYSAAKPYTDAGKGVFIAALAGTLPFIALNNSRSNMSSWSTHFGVGISIGAIAGLGAGMYANAHRDDSRAVRENARRVKAREDFNAGVRARNRARLDKTILIIRPLTSAGISG